MKKLVIFLILIALVFITYKSFFNDESKINSFVASVPCTNECAVDSRMCVDDFTYTIRARNSSEVIILGKRNLIKIGDLQ